jgi:thioredoxin reductase (NADPH)
MTTIEPRSTKPVLMTVDDDPGVSRAVARDLRRRYGQDHRIVRAESGRDALDALRELTLRGEPVAAILADYRMPEMNGIEFLEQAMDIAPHARRALLTAYADTDAAIQAINLVDVDHYLLKPWDPPEEKLYPVVDALVETWRAVGQRPVDEIRVVGHRWSAECFSARDFLARNSVPYRYYSIDEPEGARLLEAAGAGPEDVPVLITTDGTALRSPTDAEIAAAVGLTTEPATDFYDLIVIGGGPAGLGSAVYGASEGLRTVLVERAAPGGQAGQSSRIENYLGFPNGLSGADLARRAHDQARKFGAELLSVQEVTGLQARGPQRVVTLAGGEELAAHSVLIATGVAYRRLDAPGVETLEGRGIYYGASLVEAEACKGQTVAVVGGANSAGQAAVYLSRQAGRVVMLVRGDSLERSMSHYLIEQIGAIDTIEVRTGTEVVAAEGDGKLQALRVSGRDGEEELAATSMFVFIGAAPYTDWVGDHVGRDVRGFVLAGPDAAAAERHRWPLERDPFLLETTLPGVFVAGDVRHRSIKRVASAVGEGSMSVQFIHQYLADT